MNLVLRSTSDFVCNSLLTVNRCESGENDGRTKRIMGMAMRMSNQQQQKRKRWALTSFHKDLLKVVLSLDGLSCSPEAIRRKMFGLTTYKNWQLDAVKIHEECYALAKRDFLNKNRQTYSITEYGIFCLGEG